MVIPSSAPEELPSADTKSNDKPRFQWVSDQIWSELNASECTNHSPLPSERNVARRFGVSRMTARRALEALELKGLIYSANRKGRFISPDRLTYDISRGYNFFSDAKTRGVHLEIEVLEKNVGNACETIAQKLWVSPGEPLYEYTRRFTSEGHTIFIETEVLIASRFPGFLDNDLTGSTTHLFESVYNTFARTGDLVIRMRSTERHEARWLGLADAQPAIELQQIVRDEAGTPFCFSHLLWRGELTEFTARMVVDEGARRP